MTSPVDVDRFARLLEAMIEAPRSFCGAVAIAEELFGTRREQIAAIERYVALRAVVDVARLSGAALRAAAIAGARAPLAGSRYRARRFIPEAFAQAAPSAAARFFNHEEII